MARQQQGMLATPAKPCLCRESNLQHRRAIGKDAIAEAAYGGSDAIRQALQLAAQDAVIIASERVA